MPKDTGSIFYEKDGKVIVLLVGGDKSTQQKKDIEKAKGILRRLKK